MKIWIAWALVYVAAVLVHSKRTNLAAWQPLGTEFDRDSADVSEMCTYNSLRDQVQVLDLGTRIHVYFRYMGLPDADHVVTDFMAYAVDDMFSLLELKIHDVNRRNEDPSMLIIPVYRKINESHSFTVRIQK